MPDATGFIADLQPAASVSADGVVQKLLPGTDLPADWWHLFKSAPLNEAVQTALRDNPTLDAARASLAQSSDNLRAGEGVFYPQVGASLESTRARTAPGQGAASAPDSVFDVVTASGSIAYVVDVFGGERRAVEGLRAQVDVRRFAVRAAYLTLTANVASTWIARAGYAAQERATEELIGLEMEQLQSVEAQVRAGLSPYSSVLTQRGLIAANRALLAPLQYRVNQATHLLVLLDGGAPVANTSLALELDSMTLPTDLPTGLPSDLVRQRPDLRSAEAQLHAASADIGVATAALFPSFTLNANFGRAGSGLNNLIGSAGNFWSVGSAIAAPLFHGGTLRAERQAAIDAFDVQRANYRLVALTAFDQVADAMKAIEYDAQELQAQDEAQTAAGQALTLLRVNYDSGLAAYTDVLAADIQFHTATIAYLQGRAQRYQATVGLFVALGGGWWNELPATGDAEPIAHLPSADQP